MTNAADIYGKSMYELAVSEKITDDICGQAEEVRKLFEDNPDYIRLLSEPSIHLQERQKLLDEAFGSQIHVYLLNFLKLLTERGLIGEYGACCRIMRQMYNRDHGIAEAVVTSAVPLSEEQVRKLLEKLTAKTGKKIEFVQKVNPEVLGGIRVEIDGELLDGTVQTRLKDLRGKIGSTVL